MPFIFHCSNPASAHNTQRRKTVTFLETIECPNIPGKQSGTNPNHLQRSHSDVDDFPLPPPPLPIHGTAIHHQQNNPNSDATTNSDSGSSVLTSPPSSARNDAADYVESRV